MPRKHKTIEKDELDFYIEKYKSGIPVRELCPIYGRTDATIINALKRVGVYVDQNSRWTNDEMDILRKYYPTESMDFLLSILPRHANPQLIICKASKLGIKKKNGRWTSEELKILKENYETMSANELYELLGRTHSIVAIRAKAQRIRCVNDPFWSLEEDQILKENYAFRSFSEIQNLLPNKTANAIMAHAKKLGVKSKFYLEEQYSKEQLAFIKEHWMSMSDGQIAQCLGRKSPEGIRAKRVQMGLYKIKQDYSNYTNLDRFFRGHLQQWKTDSIKACNYKCILTGSKDFAVHHLYGFNIILKEVYQELDQRLLLKSNNLDDYTKEELDLFLQIFHEIHDKYPLGVCIRKDLHDLFHRIYGAGGNTESQWNLFYEDYKNGVYNLQIA